MQDNLRFAINTRGAVVDFTSDTGVLYQVSAPDTTRDLLHHTPAYVEAPNTALNRTHKTVNAGI